MIRFPCPHCGRRLKITDEYAGRSTRCPHCRNTIKIPQPGSAGPLSAPSPAAPPQEDEPLAALAQVASAAPVIAHEPVVPPPPQTASVPIAPRLGSALKPFWLAGAIVGSAAILAMLASLTGRSGDARDIEFALPRSSGASFDPASQRDQLSVVVAALKRYAQAMDGRYPAHVGELLDAGQLPPTTLVTVSPPPTRGDGENPWASEDPFGPYRVGDVVFTYWCTDGHPLPGEALVACSARGAGEEGRRAVALADGRVNVLDREAFVALVRRQNELRRDPWGHQPPIRAEVFTP